MKLCLRKKNVIVKNVTNFRDETPLLGSDWPSNVDGLQWDVSTIANFASNVGVILAECPAQEELVVAMYHQERIINQPKCEGKMLCPLDSFVEGLADIGYQNFDEICSV